MRSTASAPAAPSFGWVAGSGLKAGTVQLLALQVSATCSMPVPAYAFEIQTYGARPAKTPTPPRTCCFVLPPGFQLNPTRGDHTNSSAGCVPVLKPMTFMTVWLNDGVSLKRGLSARRPNVNDTLLLACHWSLTYRPNCSAPNCVGRSGSEPVA